ncbi:hypothetical protein [Oceanobacillus alkalisoli]|uniref:hypothetical protein n=1 Tax=Oceanobacillus alkalisoli TaxID=2925113 RepID=UPI001F119ECA|nr:hypothetical protein [Oceanobacillus alkalisoli]MCF3943964.1 hypothetical protein [Oceanobacillus alkalisoli]
MSIPECFAKAVNAGTDIVADSNDIENLKAAYENGWISERRINEANVKLLTEMFETYRKQAAEAVSELEEFTLTDNYEEADIALLF